MHTILTIRTCAGFWEGLLRAKVSNKSIKIGIDSCHMLEILGLKKSRIELIRGHEGDRQNARRGAPP